MAPHKCPTEFRIESVTAQKKLAAEFQKTYGKNAGKEALRMAQLAETAYDTKSALIWVSIFMRLKVEDCEKFLPANLRIKSNGS